MNKDITKLDATETAFLTRQLEYVKAKTYDVKYRNLHAMELIPVSFETPAGAETIKYREWSKAGMAKIISDYAHDFPRVDTWCVEKESKVRGMGDSYGFSVLEIRRAQMAHNNLDTRRAKTARRAIDELMDKLAWYGDSDFNIQGFFNYPGITSYTIPNGASASKLWSTKTPDEIIIDLTGIMSAIEVPTKGREVANTILLPRTQYNQIKNTRMTDGNDKTILTFFKSNNPGVAVVPLDEIVGQGSGGTDRIMAYTKHPENLTQEIPHAFEQFSPQWKGMEASVPCHAEFGGVIIYYPQSVAYGDGI